MTRRFRAFGLLLLAMALVASACGGGDEQELPGAGGPDAGGDAILSEAEVEEGGTLIQLAPSYIDNMDPHLQSSYNTHQVVGPAYSRLLAFRTGPDVEYGDQELIGDLAESWEVSEDALTYTFHLREDVVWHDIPPVNGRPFVAADVVATFNRIMDIGFQRYMLERVASVEATDEHTVVVTMSEPFAPFLGYMANHYMWILPQEAAQGLYDPAATVIGTGPFVMADREPNVSITYEANENYYGEGPHIDGFRRLIVPDQGARIAAFRAGEADFIDGLSPEETQSVLGSTEGAELVTLLSPTHLVIFINQEQPPLDDVRVRQAINLAVNKEALGEAIYGGGAFSGPVVGSLGEWALPEEELAEIYAFDPERARELLTEAGFADGISIGLVVTPGYGEQVTRGAAWVAQDLAAVGINATIEQVEYATYFGARWPQKQYDIIVGLQTPFLEPDEWLRAQHFSTASRNWFGINDPVLDEMLLEQLEIVDRQERVEAVHEIQRYIAENVMNPVPLWDYNTYTLASERVRDWFPSPDYGYFEYRQLWLDQDG